jgi:hypothetical protein
VRKRAGLAALREAIERAIPLSAGKYHAAIYSSQTQDRIALLVQRDGADGAEQIAPNWRLRQPAALSRRSAMVANALVVSHMMTGGLMGRRTRRHRGMNRIRLAGL